MRMIIRDNIEQYMQELKSWLAETEDDGLEEMGEFFTARVSGYEEHMEIWEKAYQRMTELIPLESRKILDLGCGTGLELDAIWQRRSDIDIAGVDLCQSMLDKLIKKHSDKPLKTICADYFQYDMGSKVWDTVISFESLHHFLPDKKQQLYSKVYGSLKSNGVFIIGDYIACSKEEEELLRSTCLERRKKYNIPADQFIHFDIPLTLEHEIRLLKMAGFSKIEAVDSILGATIICAGKQEQ